MADTTDPLAGLTVKQRRFIEAYTGVARGNATEAASLAGYKGSRRTLESVGRENLGKPRISAAIMERLQAGAAEEEMTAAELRVFFSNCARNSLPDGRDVKVAESITAANSLAKMKGLMLEPQAFAQFLLGLRGRMSESGFAEVMAAAHLEEGQ